MAHTAHKRRNQVAHLSPKPRYLEPHGTSTNQPEFDAKSILMLIHLYTYTLIHLYTYTLIHLYTYTVYNYTLIHLYTYTVYTMQGGETNTDTGKMLIHVYVYRRVRVTDLLSALFHVYLHRGLAFCYPNIIFKEL